MHMMQSKRKAAMRDQVIEANEWDMDMKDRNQYKEIIELDKIIGKIKDYSCY
jgi:hypothetical protein